MDITRETIKSPFWSVDIDKTLKLLHTSKDGLAAEEVIKRQKIFGTNVIRERNRRTKLSLILSQLKSPLIIILIAAGGLTIFLGEWIDTGVILATVVINTFFGFWQENKAETILELMKTYIKTRANVRRNGTDHEIEASNLVPGDIIRIRQGERIPADSRIIFANDFEVDESILTGESLSVYKEADPIPVASAVSNRQSMVFGGTLVVQGIAEAVVVATGGSTEFGKIADMVSISDRESTPLQLSIRRFSFYSISILVFLTTVLFIAGVYQGSSFFDIFLIAIAVAVSAVPEGLPIALTVILAVGVQRLSKKKGIVRRLLAAETLGSTTLILTDKTGTLTEAKMKLVSVISQKQGEEANMLKNALLATDLIIENPDDNFNNWILSGRPLEMSLAVGAAGRGILLPEVHRASKVISYLPFNSKDKFSAAIYQDQHSTRLAVFGAPDIILRFSSLDKKKKELLTAEIDSRAYSGERVLGIATMEISKEQVQHIFTRKFKDLEFGGLISFRDPIRESVKHALADIVSSGVRTVIVTGDHKGTAESVAKEIGLMKEGQLVLSGDDLKLISAEELNACADNVAVYARVTPDQKLMLTELYQKKGETVAVTGDGVNDAPALSKADIGIAIGSGTDVAKSAADLVILDDNFETIVVAIKEGRRIIQNIRKVILYLLSDSLDELILIGGSILVGLALPINALQILYVNFFSDSLPAIALSFEENTDGTGGKPKRLKGGLFDKEMKFFILIIGVFSSASLFFLYSFLSAKGFDPEIVKTFIFASFASYTLLLTFSLRNLEKSILTYNPFSNKYLTISVFVGLALIVLSIYIPLGQNILNTAPLPLPWLAGVLVVGLFNILLIEIGKVIVKKFFSLNKADKKS